TVDGGHGQLARQTREGPPRATRPETRTPVHWKPDIQATRKGIRGRRPEAIREWQRGYGSVPPKRHPQWIGGDLPRRSGANRTWLSTASVFGIIPATQERMPCAGTSRRCSTSTLPRRTTKSGKRRSSS